MNGNILDFEVKQRMYCFYNAFFVSNYFSKSYAWTFTYVYLFNSKLYTVSAKAIEKLKQININLE